MTGMGYWSFSVSDAIIFFSYINSPTYHQLILPPYIIEVIDEASSRENQHIQGIGMQNYKQGTNIFNLNITKMAQAAPWGKLGEGLFYMVFDFRTF